MGNITGRTTIGVGQTTGADTSSNDGDNEIDLYVSDDIAIAMDDTDAVTITDVDPTWNWTRNGLFRIVNGSPVPDAIGTITVPAVKRARVTFKNETAFDQIITISGQSETADVVPPGHTRVFASDGSNIRLSNQESDPLRAFFTNADTLVADGIVAVWLADRELTFLDDFLNSLGRAIDGPVGGAVDFDVQVDGVSVGTISFADVGTSGVSQTATFVNAATAEEVVAAGSRIELIAPSNIQSIDQVAITLQALRG